MAAACARMALAVRTPDPPRPGMYTWYGACKACVSISGMPAASMEGSPGFLRPLPGATSTVTKEGHSPWMQAWSWLHVDWWICVLAPNSVGTFCSDMQFALAPQSPQFSHTSSLTKVNTVG